MTTPNQTGRNEPCPCGSGLKYKACCCGKTNPARSLWNSPYLLLALALVVVAAAFVVVRERKEKETDNAAATAPAAPVRPVSVPGTGTGTSSPVTLSPVQDPSALMADATSPPGVLTPQPPGPAPEGKIWSPDHGHWHDAPGAVAPSGVSPPATPAAAPTFTPPPPGPAPEGKIWSPEHGHWHDVAPQPATPPNP